HVLAGVVTHVQTGQLVRRRLVGQDEPIRSVGVRGHAADERDRLTGRGRLRLLVLNRHRAGARRDHQRKDENRDVEVSHALILTADPALEQGGYTRPMARRAIAIVLSLLGVAVLLSIAAFAAL